MKGNNYSITPSLEFFFVFTCGIPLLFRGKSLYELLDYLGSNLCPLD